MIQTSPRITITETPRSAARNRGFGEADGRVPGSTAQPGASILAEIGNGGTA